MGHLSKVQGIAKAIPLEEGRDQVPEPVRCFKDYFARWVNDVLAIMAGVKNFHFATSPSRLQEQGRAGVLVENKHWAISL